MENQRKSNFKVRRFRTPHGIKLHKANAVANVQAIQTHDFFNLTLPKIFSLIEKELYTALPKHKLKYELSLGSNVWSFDQVDELSAFFQQRAKNKGVFFGTHVLTIYGFTRSGFEVVFSIMP